jgi:MFS family permease
MYFGWALGTIVSLSVVVWTGSLLIQAYGMAVDEASYLFGSIGMVAGVSGIFLWPSLLVMATRRGRPDAMVLLLAFATLLGSLATILLGLSPNRFGALCGLAGVMFGFSVWSALPSLIVQNLSPGQMRGRLISFNLLSANVIGLTIGPPLIAALADNVFEGPRALGYALAASAAIVGPVAAIALWQMRRPYLRALHEVVVRERNSSPMANE